eukprot:scaffold41116_cov46-Prasinocladus_malaysianus.AAC.2
MAFLSVSAWAAPDKVRPTRQPRSVLRASSLSRTSALSRTPESNVAEWICKACVSSDWLARWSAVCSLTSWGSPFVSTRQSAVYL